MEPQRIKIDRKILLVAFAVALLMVGLLIYTNRGDAGVVNPYSDRDIEGDMGKRFAIIYEFADLYEAIGQNEQVLRNIQEDLLLFARTTRPELNVKDSLVSFTVSKQLNKEGETSVFLGKYYGVDDDIRLAIEPQGRGVFTLSVTNLVDQTNLDKFLRMNGPRNKYISELPLQSGSYSIRYQLVEDRIVVSFYDGYTNQDIDMVIESLSAGLGPNYVDETVFSINRIGIVGLDGVRQNLANPFNP